MIIDIHAHVTVDPAAQLRRAALADVGLTFLLSTRVHPETARTPAEVRAEFGRLSAVVGGAAASFDECEAGMVELRAAITTHPQNTVGFANAPLGHDAKKTEDWIALQLADPSVVGIGELTPPPGAARLIEPVLQISAEHGGVPVLTHGFAPNTDDDLVTYAKLAARYPTVPLIVGAFGGLNCLQLIDLARERPNLYLDLSSALQVFAVGAAAREVPEQCLFGSNTPYGDVVAACHTVAAAVGDPVVLQRVLHDNAAQLFERLVERPSADPRV